MLTGPLDPHALSEGRKTYAMLPALAPGEAITSLPMHWSVEDYGCVDGAYNLVVALNGKAWTVMIATSPLLNATEPPQDGYAAHTYLRNGNACGIAVNGMVGATTNNFGMEGIQLHEIEVLCAAAAAACRKYGVDSHGEHNGLPAVFTHAEAAVVDFYANERWDLGRLVASSAPLTVAERTQTGNLLRARVHSYAMEIPG